MHCFSIGWLVGYECISQTWDAIFRCWSAHSHHVVLIAILRGVCAFRSGLDILCNHTSLYSLDNTWCGVLMVPGVIGWSYQINSRQAKQNYTKKTGEEATLCVLIMCVLQVAQMLLFCLFIGFHFCLPVYINRSEVFPEYTLFQPLLNCEINYLRQLLYAKIVCQIDRWPLSPGWLQNNLTN